MGEYCERLHKYDHKTEQFDAWSQYPQEWDIWDDKASIAMDNRNNVLYILGRCNDMDLLRVNISSKSCRLYQNTNDDCGQVDETSYI